MNSYFISSFTSPAGSTAQVHLLLHHSSSGTDRKGRLFISFAVRKYIFSKTLCLLLPGISAGFVSPPKSAESVVILPPGRLSDLAALTVLAIVVLLSGMMRSASEASLSTAWVLHCTMTLTSCDQCVFL